MPRSKCHECYQQCIFFQEQTSESGSRDIAPYTGSCIHKSQYVSSLSVKVNLGSSPLLGALPIKITLVKTQWLCRCHAPVLTETPLTLTVDPYKDSTGQITLYCPVQLCKGDQIALRVEPPKDSTANFRVNAQLC
jgi:hypothetical protein